MPTESDEISQILLKKLREEPLTPMEEAALAEWKGRSPRHAAFMASLINESMLAEKIRGLLAADEETAWKQIDQSIDAQSHEQERPIRTRIWVKYTSVASLVLVLSVAGYFFLKRKSVSENPKTTKPVAKVDIAPGGNRAVLTLSGGSVIDLEKAAPGIMVEQGGSKAVKKDQGKLEYEKTAYGDPAGVHVLTTPRGGEYQLRLPDGTKVWVNAASFIKFPTSFPGNERVVEAGGELYFEVAKMAGKPFRVIIHSAMKGNTAVEVLGTHFNIMAYEDESSINTTLLEGKVIIHALHSKALYAGQQAQLFPGNKLSVIHVDTNRVVSWKNGSFSFQDAGIATVMRQVSRWYDVEVAYEGDVPDTRLNGSFPRTMTIEGLLRALETMGLRSRINGRTITFFQ